MGKSDWLEIGLKLLGIYFLVTGVVGLWRTAVTLLIAAAGGGPLACNTALALLLPAAQLFAGIVLVRWRWQVAESSRRRSERLPGHLEQSFGRMEQGGGRRPP